MIDFSDLSTTREELDSVLKDLRTDEELRLKIYLDSTGNRTIGYGHNLDELGISEIIANALLIEDLTTAVSELNSKLPWWKTLSKTQRRALINMSFNLGITKLLLYKKMLAALKKGKSELAAVEALDSIWADQVGSRAWRIAALFRNEGE